MTIKKNKPAGKATGKENSQQQAPRQQLKKLSEYGKQLQEKQRVKSMYGMRERQFRRFFEIAKKSKSATGEALLSLLERRIDNVVLRLKFATTSTQARQMVVHGHIALNGKRVYSPSLLVAQNDVISIHPNSLQKSGLLKEVVEQSINKSHKIPEWMECDKNRFLGRIIRIPVRADIQATINENFIVELYSK